LLQKIPFGRTISYADLAARAGSPRAFRAVARANATNPVSLFVPCHRVIGKSGDLRGYGWGPARKDWLLRHEARS
jgi:O-6-methylguanine DNA methyltransferase